MSDASNIILHLDSEKSWRGGEQQLIYLLNGLRQNNIITFLACPPSSALFTAAREEGITVFPVPFRGEWDLGSVIELRSLIRNLKATIVHCHSSHSHAIAWFATRGMKDCKLIVTRRVDFPVAKNFLSSWKYKKGIARIIAVSEGVKKVLVDSGLDPRKISVVHDGTETSHYACRDKATYLYKELGLTPGKPVIGNIAALAPHKHQANLLEAAKIVIDQFPDAQFLIVGEGELEPALKRLADNLNIKKNIIFTGFRKDVPQILTILDIFAVSSYLEGLGSSTLEAMAAGLPIVATNTGGIPEVVDNGVNGLLVPTRNAPALAKAITGLLEKPELRKKMGLMSLKKVQDFSVEKMVAGNIEVYKQLSGRVSD